MLVEYFFFSQTDNNTYSGGKRMRSTERNNSNKRPKPTVVSVAFDEDTGLVVRDATPSEQVVFPDPETFPVHIASLEEYGFTEVSPNTSSYDRYRLVDTKNDTRIVQQKGYLVGNPVDFPAAILIRSKLSCGPYIVTGDNGQIVGRIYVTAHESNPGNADEIHRQFNPAGFPILADIFDLTVKPQTVTHHLALSERLPQGEYRMTMKLGDHKYASAQFFIENLRLTKYD